MLDLYHHLLRLWHRRACAEARSAIRRSEGHDHTVVVLIADVDSLRVAQIRVHDQTGNATFEVTVSRRHRDLLTGSVVIDVRPIAHLQPRAITVDRPHLAHRAPLPIRHAWPRPATDDPDPDISWWERKLASVQERSNGT